MNQRRLKLDKSDHKYSFATVVEIAQFFYQLGHVDGWQDAWALRTTTKASPVEDRQEKSV